MPQPNFYFLTGSAGFLGKAILRSMLQSQPNAHIYCLLRPKRFNSPEQRIAQTLSRIACEQEIHRVTVLTGDLAEPHFGLTQDEYYALSHKITHIIHCAAKVDFIAPAQLMQRENILTTQNILHFTQACCEHSPHFKNLSYISTAYVAGKRKGLVKENDFNDAFGFKNIYEETKYAAEQYVRMHGKDLPIMIFRPSIIISGSEDNTTDRSNVLYPLVRCAQAAPYLLVPANNTLLDCVPVDFVANAIQSLSCDSHAIGKTFHLTAGVGQEITITKILQTMNLVLNTKLTRVPTWVFNLSKPLHRYMPSSLIRTFTAYHPYLVQNPQFCTQQTQNFLKKHQIVYPNTEEILTKTIYHLKNIIAE